MFQLFLELIIEVYFDILAVDNEPPTLSCPSNIIQEVTSGNLNGAVVTWSPATVSDNSGEPLTAVLTNTQQTSGSFFVFGSYTIEYAATDASGNRGVCDFLVSVGKFSLK